MKPDVYTLLEKELGRGKVLRDEERMCLCGMLAADFTTLARPVRDEVRRFFDDNEVWLSRVLEAGRRARTLAFKGSASAQAVVLVSACLYVLLNLGADVLYFLANPRLRSSA